MSYDYTVFRDEIITYHIYGRLPVRHDDHVGTLDEMAQTVMIPVQLEPVVMMVAFLKITYVTDFDDTLSGMYVPILLHQRVVYRKDMLFYTIIPIFPYLCNRFALVVE